MDVKLNREELQMWKRTYRGRVQQEETLEAVVPDALPDAAELIDADVCILLRSKETEDGAVTAAMQLKGSAICRGDGGEVYSVPLNGTVSCRWEDTAIAREDQSQLQLRLTSSDARLVNPRKLLLRCTVEAEAECYRPEWKEYVTGAEENVQQCLKTETVSVVAAVSEKTFVISEEFPPEEGGAEEILLSRVSCRVEDVRDVAGKAVVQGKLTLELLYTTTEEEPPRFRACELPFSQIVDAPESFSFSRFTLLPTAVYTELLPAVMGGGISLEAHFVAQAVFCAEREISYLVDAYSTVCPEELEREEITVSAPGRETVRHLTLRENAELREEVSRVLWCCVSSAKSTWDSAGGRLTAYARVLYLNGSGELSCASVLLQQELGEEERAEHSELCILESYASAAGKGIEVRLGAEYRSTEEVTTVLRPLSSVALREGEPYEVLQRPSLVAVRNTNADLWTLARKYLSTRALIEEANPGMGENSGFLLIPRVR